MTISISTQTMAGVHVAHSGSITELAQHHGHKITAFTDKLAACRGADWGHDIQYGRPGI